jgi:hypothetical protein
MIFDFFKEKKIQKPTLSQERAGSVVKFMIKEPAKK